MSTVPCVTMMSPFATFSSLETRSRMSDEPCPCRIDPPFGLLAPQVCGKPALGIFYDHLANVADRSGGDPRAHLAYEWIT